MIGRGPALEMYRSALAATNRLAGFYNRNYVVDGSAGCGPDERALVRIPMENADQMDLRLWPEPAVLAALAPLTLPMPRVLHVSSDPRFTVLEYVDGPVLNDVKPPGTDVGESVVRACADLLVRLEAADAEVAPPVPLGWPRSGETGRFASRLLALTLDRVAEAFAAHPALFRAFGFPADPLATIARAMPRMHARDFHLIHCDIHRKNIIVPDRTVVFLDWELSLWGDPVYDLAVHLHKMRYSATEDELLTRTWADRVAPRFSAAWEADLAIYRAHETLKSAIVDTVRQIARLRAAEPESDTPDSWRYLTEKIGRAADVLLLDDAPDADRLRETVMAELTVGQR